VSRMLSSRDPVAVARAAKLLVQDEEWRNLPAPDDRAKIAMALGSRLPFALLTLPPGSLDALAAVGRELAGGACNWCAAAAIRMPEPELPRDEVFSAILGKPCGSCRTRWETAAVATREKVHVDQLVAAGFRPVAAANLRTPEQVATYTSSLRSLTAAKLPPPVTRKPLPPFYGSRRVQPRR
jgi:hypothetical protein